MVTGKNTFSKEERICIDRQITRLFEHGASFICYPVRVVWIESQETSSKPVKILISVSKKKLRHSVDRNRVKRLIRESYRINKSKLNEAAQSAGKVVSICFIWLPSEAVEFIKMERKMREALDRISFQIDAHKKKPYHE
jgi:ribonuclease P protein component